MKQTSSARMQCDAFLLLLPSLFRGAGEQREEGGKEKERGLFFSFTTPKGDGAGVGPESGT